MSAPLPTGSARHTAIVPVLVPFLAAFASFLGACGGGGGGGGGGGNPAAIDEIEPNDSTATATFVKVGTPVEGEVGTAGDVDNFRFTLTAGRVIQLELCGTRNDQTTWDANNNVPRLTLLDNLSSKLLEHDYGGNFSTNGWSADWGKHDLDMPWFLVPASGDYFVAVTQDDQGLDGGEYVLRVRYVTVPGLQQEAEPPATLGANNTDGTAEPITPGTVHGYHAASDLDYYSFVITSPSIVRFEMTAYRNGISQDTGAYFDPSLHLFDDDGTTELDFSDDSFFFDPAIRFRLETPGTYFVSVDEFDPASGEYFLTYSLSAASATAETEPNDTAATADPLAYGGRVSGAMDTGEVDFYAFSGTAGDMVRLEFFDSVNNQAALDQVVVTLIDPDQATPLATGGFIFLQVQTTILQETGTFYVMVEPDGTPAATSYVLELTRFQAATYETEANDTIATADLLGDRSAGVIDPAGDVDVFAVTLTGDRFASVAIYASNVPTGSNGNFELSGHGSALEPLIEILDGASVVVSSSTSVPVDVFTEGVVDSLPTAAVCEVPDPGGTYYVRVSDANGAGGPGFYYVVEKR